MIRIRTRTMPDLLPLRVEDSTEFGHRLPAAYLRRFAYCVAMLAVPVMGCGAAEQLRRAEPAIGRHVADMFVFAVMRNDPERIIRSVSTASSASTRRQQGGER